MCNPRSLKEGTETQRPVAIVAVPPLYGRGTQSRLLSEKLIALAVAVVKAAAEAELERRWRPQEGALGDEQTEGLQPAVGWRQQRTAGAGYVKTPPSAAVRRRTVGQSPPPLRRIGRPGRSGRLRNDVCQTPSYPPRSAIGADSLISTKVSHRWRSWTTNVDIV